MLGRTVPPPPETLAHSAGATVPRRAPPAPPVRRPRPPHRREAARAAPSTHSSAASGSTARVGRSRSATSRPEGSSHGGRSRRRIAGSPLRRPLPVASQQSTALTTCRAAVALGPHRTAVRIGRARGRPMLASTCRSTAASPSDERVIPPRCATSASRRPRGGTPPHPAEGQPSVTTSPRSRCPCRRRGRCRSRCPTDADGDRGADERSLLSPGPVAPHADDDGTDRDAWIISGRRRRRAEDPGPAVEPGRSRSGSAGCSG